MHYSEKHRTTARIRRNDRLFLIDTSGKEIKTKQTNKKYICIQKKVHHILWMVTIQQTTKSNSYIYIYKIILLNKN